MDPAIISYATLGCLILLIIMVILNMYNIFKIKKVTDMVNEADKSRGEPENMIVYKY